MKSHELRSQRNEAIRFINKLRVLANNYETFKIMDELKHLDRKIVTIDSPKANSRSSHEIKSDALSTFKRLGKLAEEGRTELIREELEEMDTDSCTYQDIGNFSIRPMSALDYVFHAYPVPSHKEDESRGARFVLAHELLDKNASVTTRAFIMALAENKEEIIRTLKPHINENIFLTELADEMSVIVANAISVRDEKRNPIFYRFSDVKQAMQRILEQGVKLTNQHLSIALVRPELSVAKQLMEFGAPVLENLYNSNLEKGLSKPSPMTDHTAQLFLQKCRAVLNSYYKYKIEPFLEKIPPVPTYTGLFENWRKSQEIKNAKKELDCKQVCGESLKEKCALRSAVRLNLHGQLREIRDNFIEICKLLLSMSHTLTREETIAHFMHDLFDKDNAHRFVLVRYHPDNYYHDEKRLDILQDVIIHFEKNELPVIQKRELELSKVKLAMQI